MFEEQRLLLKQRAHRQDRIVKPSWLPTVTNGVWVERGSHSSPRRWWLRSKQRRRNFAHDLFSETTEVHFPFRCLTANVTFLITFTFVCLMSAWPPLLWEEHRVLRCRDRWFDTYARSSQRSRRRIRYCHFNLKLLPVGTARSQIVV